MEDRDLEKNSTAVEKFYLRKGEASRKLQQLSFNQEVKATRQRNTKTFLFKKIRKKEREKENTKRKKFK